MKDITIGIIIGIVIIGIFVGIGIFLNINMPKDVEIPNLIGLTVDEAEKVVKEIGLYIEVKGENTEGTIVYQDPPFSEGATVKNNTVIWVRLNKEKN